MTIQNVVPYLSVKNAAKAVEFYTSAFGCKPTLRIDMPDGRVMHCEFQIGQSKIFISEELPEHGGTPSPTTMKATTVAIHLYVDDCDGMFERMKAGGAEVLAEPDDLFWGERFARIRDPFGHEWGIAQRTREMSPEEIKHAAAKLFQQS